MPKVDPFWKRQFKQDLLVLASTLGRETSTEDGQWAVKGFIDAFKNIYTLSADTKVISKILEIHLFPILSRFALEHQYHIVLADHQNYYPDLTFISSQNDKIKFALDIKTTYRLPNKEGFCNGFTLGSHGSYFINRTTRKNIQFPYDEYLGHFCLGILYTRADSLKIDETQSCTMDRLSSIVSVIRDLQFFSCEKWEIASDSQGSGNTANIGSIVRIEDLLNGNGVFKNLGESWFDQYWMNYGKIMVPTPEGSAKKITKLRDFLEFKGMSPDLANAMIRTNRAPKESTDE